MTSKDVGLIDYAGGSSAMLTLVTEHPASHYGIGVLILGPSGDLPDADAGRILDGIYFRHLRDEYGDTIYCKPGMLLCVCDALGVPEDEPGIEEGI